MRHKIKKSVELYSWIQKSSLLLRNLLTSLIKDWKVVTTPKKALALNVFTNKFFTKLLRLYKIHENELDVKREAIRIIKSTIFTEIEWKKVLSEYLPYFKEKWMSSWFIKKYKLWLRKWDWVEKNLLKLNK